MIRIGSYIHASLQGWHLWAFSAYVVEAGRSGRKRGENLSCRSHRESCHISPPFFLLSCHSCQADISTSSSVSMSSIFPSISFSYCLLKVLLHPICHHIVHSSVYLFNPSTECFISITMFFIVKISNVVYFYDTCSYSWMLYPCIISDGTNDAYSNGSFEFYQLCFK